MNQELPSEQRDELKGEIRNFVQTLERKYTKTIKGNEAGFKNFVLGTLKAHLPRGKPGVIPNDAVKQALKLYQKHLAKYPHKEKKMDWKSAAEAVIPGFSQLSLEIQKYRVMKLRSNAYSASYDQKSREKRNTTLKSRLNHTLDSGDGLSAN